MFNNANYIKIMQGCSDAEINAAKVNTWLDFGWLIGYGGILFFLNIIFIDKNFINNKYLKSVAFAGLIAAILDTVEDIILLILLYNYPVKLESLPFIVSLIASIKFILVIYSILATILNLIVFIIKKKKLKSINNFIN
jgi:hypothetical protein